MDDLNRLLPVLLRKNGTADIRVIGVSMEPQLFEGDSIKVCACDTYAPSDILVYFYQGKLLVHRLLKKENGICYCKGDNALRLEDVPQSEVLGKVVSVNGEPPTPWPPWKLEFSLAMHRLCVFHGHDPVKTRQDPLYKIYQTIILRKEVNNMLYQKNAAMDYIPTDENTLVVFDPDSGNTHILDETAADILGCMEPPCDLETLLWRLCAIYEATPDDIRADVEEFLADMAQKKVVQAQ